RAALPVPPYTTRSSGRSATSGSRLLWSIRSAASWIHPLQRRVDPRGARTGRGPLGALVSFGMLCSLPQVGAALEVRERVLVELGEVALRKLAAREREHDLAVEVVEVLGVDLPVCARGGGERLDALPEAGELPGRKAAGRVRQRAAERRRHPQPVLRRVDAQ